MKPRLSADAFLVFKVTFLLFMVTSIYGDYRLRQMNLRETGTMTVVIAAAGFATLLFLFLATAIPDLTAPKRLVFPLTITLPVVYGMLLLLSGVLWTSTGNALFEVPQALRAATLWSDPGALAILVVLQILTLGLVSALGDASRRRPSDRSMGS
jgi:hypothetical protein